MEVRILLVFKKLILIGMYIVLLDYTYPDKLIFYTKTRKIYLQCIAKAPAYSCGDLGNTFLR